MISFKLTTAVAALLLGAASGVCNEDLTKADHASPPHRPNIVFIVADDLGWNDIGYNGSDIQTPTLDRLAGEGRRLTQHYVTPTCTPTRVGLMTGRYPSRYGVVKPAYGKIFDPDTVTLAEALKRGGYTTHLAGKWHMGSPPECTPLKYGFQSSYGYFAGQIDPYTHRYKTGEKTWHRNDTLLEETGHATDLITQEALRVIQSAHSSPFFLYVAYSVPHYPLSEPEQWLALYPDEKNDSRRLYAASVTHMDHAIGKLVDALDEAGRRSNTLLVFISDNGAEESWHSETQYEGHYADRPHTTLGDNRPLRGWKGDCYEGAIRVPAFVNWPGQLTAGTTDKPVHIVDWMPTLCSIAGVDPGPPPPWDGRDIWPVIDGSTDQLPERTLYWKTPDAAAVRHGDWKLIVSRPAAQDELYNLANDPDEKHNLADQETARVEELKAHLTRVASQDRNTAANVIDAP